MAIEAPVSRYKRTNLKIYIVVCVLAALWFGFWFGFDGYVSREFIEENTNEDGTANSTLLFNRGAAPVLALGAVFFGAWLFAVKDKKVVADEQELIVAGKRRIPYDAIESIDKTHLEKKGLFTIIYKSESGGQAQCRLDSRQFDNLSPILDHLVAQIS
jgi:hypothetical protein